MAAADYCWWRPFSCNWGWYFIHGIDVTKVVWAELRMPAVGGQPEDVRSDAHG